MKRIALVLPVLLFICGIGAIKAASKTIYTDKSYSINSGGVKGFMNLNASYNKAKVDMSVDGISAGTNKTKYIAYRMENGSLVKKSTKFAPLSLYTSYYVSFGSIGRGKWTINNQAFDGSTNYAGWNGSLKIISES